MSHDRGCSCGREPYEYSECREVNCLKRSLSSASSAATTTTVMQFDWSAVTTAVNCLAFSLSKLKPRLVVGISRGGLIPAVMLSHKLNVPMKTIRASSYEGTRKLLHKPVELKGWQEEFDDASVLVVDDIVDSGGTFNAVVNFTRRARLVALVNKKPLEYSAVASYCTVHPEIWVKFPWEVE